MSTYVANHVTTWFSGYDMTGDLNSTSLTMEYEALTADVFQPASNTTPARVRVAGLEDVQLSESGYWDSGDGLVDPTVFAALGGSTQVVAVSSDGAEQSVAYLFQSRVFSYQMFGQVGEVNPFQMSAQAARGSGLPSTPAVRCRVLKTKADVSSTGATGTAYQLGAVGASQYLYAGLFVFGAGTTLTGVVESDDNSDFSSATTRITFSSITATGGYWGTRVAGAITDDYYRLRITACTGTFSIACVAGVR